MPYELTQDQRDQYRREGYVLLKGAIRPEQVHALRKDIQALVDRAASGEGPEISWINRERRIPDRMGQLLRPGWIQPSFVDSLADGPYLDAARQVLGGPVRYSLFGMLAGGDARPYIQAWHRDLAPIEGPDEMPELERGYRTCCQVNGPLFPDRYLQIVPGSHLRPTSEEERRVLREHPTGDMPGQIDLECDPGDVALYYPNLLHRGFNPQGCFRWTMHHAFLLASAPVGAHESGQDQWIRRPGYLESMPAPIAAFLQRYLDALQEG